MTTIEELRHEANALNVCGGVAKLMRQAASELEALQKEVAELNGKNMAWALGIEQSNTDIVDMQRDEFRRIVAILHGSKSHSDQEIIDICNRAIACIEQTVPVVVQRDKAEQERDSFRAQNRELREALNVAINTVECDSIGKDGSELPWYRMAKLALSQPEAGK